MKRNLPIPPSLAALVLAASTASAAYVWDGPAEDGRFGDPDHWTPAGAAFLEEAGTFVIDDGARVRVPGTAEIGSLRLAGRDGGIRVGEEGLLRLYELSFIEAPVEITVKGSFDAVGRLDLRGKEGAVEIAVEGRFLSGNDNNQYTADADIRIDVRNGGFHEFRGAAFGSAGAGEPKTQEIVIRRGGTTRVLSDLNLRADGGSTTALRLEGGELDLTDAAYDYSRLDLDRPGNGIVFADIASRIFLDGDRRSEVEQWLADGALASTVGDLQVRYLEHDNKTLVLAKERRAATVLHVSPRGSDTNPGTAAEPLRTIQRAAELADAGDTVRVQSGVYRERVDPQRGGFSEDERIVFEAAEPGTVTITGSEPLIGWERVDGDIWETSVDNAIFGAFNPFATKMTGDWFNDRGRDHNLGVLFLDDVAMVEAEEIGNLGELIAGRPQFFATVGDARTTFRIHAPDIDPNEASVEATARKAAFYPNRPGIDWITVRGFKLRNTATPWSPPTAEQVGTIGTHWGKGWVIENNEISGSRSAAVTLGKYGDEFDNKSESAQAYVDAIFRALDEGDWHRDNVGSHVVRNNIVRDCEQAGIVGSMGSAFSTIENNVIYNMNRVSAFAGMEMAGIKLHGGIDAVIRDNLIYEVPWGIWLDWMSQGARVSRNVLHGNGPFADLYLEVNHGPLVVDNNLLLSEWSFRCISQGNALAHNLLAGRVTLGKHPTNPRETPYHACHATEVLGLHDNPRGDDHWFHNVLATGETDLEIYNTALLDVTMEGNVFLNGAKPSEHSEVPTIIEGKTLFDYRFEGEGENQTVFVELDLDRLNDGVKRRLVETAMLGTAEISGCPYENADGSPLAIDYDIFDAERDVDDLLPGPFARENADGTTVFQVWPRN